MVYSHHLTRSKTIQVSTAFHYFLAWFLPQTLFPQEAIISFIDHFHLEVFHQEIRCLWELRKLPNYAVPGVQPSKQPLITLSGQREKCFTVHCAWGLVSNNHKPLRKGISGKCHLDPSWRWKDPSMEKYQRNYRQTASQALPAWQHQIIMACPSCHYSL